MPLLPEQIAKIRQKEAQTPEALQRNPLNNYTEGWFHVTLNVRGEAPVLGYIEGTATAPDGSPDAPRCVLTALGRKVEDEWLHVQGHHPHCQCIAMQVMPEHIHALLHLLPTNTEHLGRIVNGLMIGCTHDYWDTLGIDWRQMRAQKDAAALNKAATTATKAAIQAADKALRAQWQDRDHTFSKRGPSLFVRGYNDVEAITAEEVQIKIDYIHNNPRKRLIKGAMHQFFAVRRNMKSPNWTPECIMQGLCADRYIAADRSKQVEAWQMLTVKGSCNSRGKTANMLKFLPMNEVQTPATPASLQPVLDLVGNMELLRRPLYPLICHRADAARFEEQKAAVLRVAREQGGVIVTACISPKEREVVKLLQQEQLPVIEVMADGFSEKYKPAGKAFYAVAEGRRLEVSPWVYEYSHRVMRPLTDEKGCPVLNAQGQPEMEEVADITREECMVMNEVVRLIAPKEDGWWKNAG